MKHYRSLAAHNAACNPIYYKYQDCMDEHKFGKFLGYCSALNRELDLCIREQREIKREANLQRKKQDAVRRKEEKANEKS